jgi:hypothetical protein
MTIFTKIRIALLIIFLVIATLTKATYYLFSEIKKEGRLKYCIQPLLNGIKNMKSKMIWDECGSATTKKRRP